MATRPHPQVPDDLSVLTGVRSGKRSYYRDLVRSDERMQGAVRAMDSISRALVRTVEGPRGLLEEVVRAAATHLEATWTVLALADGDLAGARPRFVVLDRGGDPVDTDADLPDDVRAEVAAIRAGTPVPRRDAHRAGRGDGADGWARVPMTLEGRVVGRLSARHGLAEPPEPDDLSVLRILANQAAVSLHTSEQYQASMTLHRRAQRLYDEARDRARDLEARTVELRQLEQRLVVAHQRELVDTERHRIARELHDSVTQYVLSAGMAVEVARGEAADLGEPAVGITRLLGTAKDLSQEAVEQLRRAIYALHQPHRETIGSLADLLAEVATHHRSHLRVQVRVDGDPQVLGADADHELARMVGEALFNVSVHAEATRAVVHLRYRPDELVVSVSDDGTGDPRDLTRRLRLEREGSPDGRHRGLANIESRARQLGGGVVFRRARIGGVRVAVTVPLPLPDHEGVIAGLVGTPHTPDQSATRSTP